MNQDDAEFIIDELNRIYPHSTDDINFLQFRNPFETLIMTILSAQTTDAAVNKIHDRLFSKYPNAEALADADQTDVEEIIRPLGYYHSKAANIIGASKILCEKYGGDVPDTIEQLTELPGVGRKTANIVTNHAFHKIYGIAVDTHVARLSNRLGLSKNRTPEKIEQDLLKLFDKKDWYQINYLLISHGRAVCNAKKPDCAGCTIKKYCEYYSNEI